MSDGLYIFGGKGIHHLQLGDGFQWSMDTSEINNVACLIIVQIGVLAELTVRQHVDFQLAYR